MASANTNNFVGASVTACRCPDNHRATVNLLGFTTSERSSRPPTP